jgi:signal transduction histidine kinase
MRVRSEKIVLHDFIDTYRDVIVAQTLEGSRGPGRLTESAEGKDAVVSFLVHLSEELRIDAESLPAPFGGETHDASARAHAAQLWADGCDAAQIARDYGGICQAITGIAIQQDAWITTREFHLLNRHVDTAIADGVTEHARLTAERRGKEEVQHLGQAAHDLRDLLSGATLAFQTLIARGLPPADASSAVLGRSLAGLRSRVDRMLLGVRAAVVKPQRQRLPLAAFIGEVAEAAQLHADERGVYLTVAPVDPALAVEGDPQLLASAVMVLLHNAIKFTPRGERVMLTTRAEEGRVLLDVQDQCGGIEPGRGDLFQPFCEQRRANRSGLGIGLSIARDAARLHGGDIRIRNMPGRGCVFSLDLPCCPAVAECEVGAGSGPRAVAAECSHGPQEEAYAQRDR